MRGETDAAKIKAFMIALAEDLDLKADPEPAGFFEAIVQLKESIDLNVELASPDHFLPPLPGWRERSIFIARQRQLDFFHYDLYSQALAKIERGHQRDLLDVREMLGRNLVQPAELRRLHAAIEPELIRYPAVDPAQLRTAVGAAVGEATDV